jgi:hypothetical protein
LISSSALSAGFLGDLSGRKLEPLRSLRTAAEAAEQVGRVRYFWDSASSRDRRFPVTIFETLGEI